MSETIELSDISAETKTRYLNYALSVITLRALPDVRDGLKPVQRRILYAMRQEGYRADGKTRKCAGVVGEVIKSYHPHGNMPVYEALTRMAQPFSLRYPLIHGEGNFGSIDGDPPAAERYTECKLMPLAEELMAELGQETVDFRPNFDGEKFEPIVLPARFPNLLVNGSVGIAVGMATNMPAHNLGEVIKACLMLIDDPELTIAQIVNIHRGPIKGPDFPLGGLMVIDQAAIRKIYETGQGSIKVQGEWEIEETKPTKKAPTKLPRKIVISSIPSSVNKGNLLAQMGEIIAQRKLPMVTDMVDESTLENPIRIVVEITDNADPQVVMAYFFKHTALQENFACNFTCLAPTEAGSASDDLRPRRLNINEILQHFLDFRFHTVRRRYEYELAELRRRIHILEGFKIIFNALDEALEIIKKSNGRLDSAANLREAFELSEIQSLAIVDLNLYRISKLEIKKIIEELREKRAAAKKIEEILASKKLLWGEVRKELEGFGQKYADKRRTKVIDVEETPAFDPEAYIIRENTNIVLTAEGWVKRVGKLASVASTRVREGDRVLSVLPASTLDFVIFLSSDGVAHTLRVDALPVSSGYGEPLAKYVRLGEGASLVGAFTTDHRFTPGGLLMPPRRTMFFGRDKEWHLLVATSDGQVLRVPLATFMTASTKAGRKYVRLSEGAKVVFVAVPTADDETMFLVADDGHVIHFKIDEVNILTGVGRGVRGIKLDRGASCLGGMILSGFRECLKAENTNGTEVEFRRGKYAPVGRGGKGYEAIKRGGFRTLIPEEPPIIDWSQVPDPKNNGG